MPQEVIAAVVGNNRTPARAWREHPGLTQAGAAARIGLLQIEYAAREALRISTVLILKASPGFWASIRNFSI